MERIAARVALLFAFVLLIGGCVGGDESTGPLSGTIDNSATADDDGWSDPEAALGGNAAGTTGPACMPNAIRRVGEYLVVNNMHGAHRLVKGDSYKQCIATSPGGFPVTWRWDVVSDQPYVKGFPQILYGINPWARIPSTDRLPVQVSDVRKLTSSYFIGLQAEGTYNLAFDLWITEDDTPIESERTHEIMIWLAGNIPPGMARDREASIAGENYDFYRSTTEDGLPFYLFIAQNRRTNGITNLGAFLFYLRANGLLPHDVYLSTIELGTEIWEGQGSAIVRAFSVGLQRWTP
jgi:hypothetical protein